MSVELFKSEFSSPWADEKADSPTRVVVLCDGPAAVSRGASGRMAAGWAERCAEEAACLPAALASREISQRPLLPGRPGTFGDLCKHLRLCISI